VQTLTKKDVEALMSTYDANPVGSLCIALSVLLRVQVTQWEQAMALLPSPFAESKELKQQDVAAMDELVKQLVERRAL